MNLRTCLFVQNDCYKKGRIITPKGVMIHSTGANNPNLRRYVQPDDGRLGRNLNGNDWNRGGTSACVHAFIGKLADASVASYQTLPWNHRAWHAGSGKKGSANNTHISFEICEDGLQDSKYFQAVYQEAVELTAFLCNRFHLNPLKDGVVLCHREGFVQGIASNHGDVLHWFPKHGKTMDDFRAEVARERNGETDMTEQGVRDIVAKMLEEKDQVIYNTMEEVPDWGKDTVEKLLRACLLQGDGTGLALSNDMLRQLVLNDRAGLYN